jgi:carbon-monoxide dehydrogenase small subunit
MMQIDFKLNGKNVSIDICPTMRLVDLLRDSLGLTGTKEGCAEGECGACIVIMDGVAVNSCLVLALQVRGREIITIEGMARDGELDILQQKFLEHTAVQCGYCTPGMLMSAKALLMTNPHPSEDEIRLALAGNLCRCTRYSKIVESVQEAVKDAAAQT